MDIALFFSSILEFLNIYYRINPLGDRVPIRVVRNGPEKNIRNSKQGYIW